MSLLILHLTDLHLNAQSIDFLDRADSIVNAAFSSVEKKDQVHIVISGDIANWGLKNEFELAEKFISRLISLIVEKVGFTPSVLIVAGNHDCNFSGDQSLRDLVIKSMSGKSGEVSPAYLDQLKSVLVDFYALQELMCEDITHVSPWLSIKTFDDCKVRYVLINSSVCSMKKEDPGRLYVPIPELSDTLEAYKTVYVMHHPFGWFQPDNARELAQHATTDGDLFLMGHEHEAWAQQVSDLYDEATITYLKGHVLRDPHDSSNSAFQTIHMDSSKGFLPRSYRWKHGAYELWSEKSKSDHIPWPDNSVRRLGLTGDGYRLLTSAGANFTHRKKDVVSLSDIYVWPNIKSISPEKDTGNSASDGLEFSSEELVISYDDFSPLVVIKGGEQFGKSALAKNLVLHLCKKGVHPVLIAASSISSWRDKRLNERIDVAIDALYGSKARDDYRRLSPKDRVLVIDDFDLGQVTKGYFEGLRSLRQYFGRIYLMLDSHPGMEVALNEFLLDENFIDSEIYEIAPSNSHHRLQLIERWLMIGSDDETAIESFKLTAAKLSKVVDETLGRNLIPSVPVFVLIILQRAELAQDLDTVVKSGSQGFLYESLITQALSTKVSVCNVITSLTYLTSFAALLDVKTADSVSQVEFEVFHVEHCKKYALPVSLGHLQAQLVAAEILDDRNDRVRFKYPFHQYYFAARFIAAIEDWSSLEPRIDALVNAIHTEKNANILLFMAHLGRNPKVAEKIIRSADEMFATYADVDLFERVEALQVYGVPAIRQILFEGAKSLQLVQHALDEADAELSQRELAEIAEAKLKDRLNDALAMNAAFKTLQVLGQVLRNHAGEIEREEKLRITNSCVSLGLRVVSFLYETVSQQGEEMIDFRGKQLRIEKAGISDVDLADELERYLPSFVSSITVGTLIKIANAIGSEDLQLTIDEALGATQTRRLLRLITQLEHFSEFPKKAILDFEEDELRVAGYLPNSILRRFIVRRFYLFPVRDELKRAVLAKFNIKALPFTFLEQRRITRH